MSSDFSSNLDLRIEPGMRGVKITLSDTTDHTMTLGSDAPDAPDNLQSARYCRGFHCNAAGTLAVYFPGETTSVSLYVNKGSYYPYAIRRFLSTGTDAGLNNNIVAFR